MAADVEDITATQDDPGAVLATLDHRITGLRRTVAETPASSRGWPVLELAEALVTRFEFRLVHATTLGEPGQEDLAETVRLTTVPEVTEADDLPWVWAGVARAAAQLYLLEVGDVAFLDEAVNRLRLARAHPGLPTEVWMQAGELLGRALATYEDVLEAEDERLDPTQAEAIELLAQAAELLDEGSDRAELDLLVARLRLGRRMRGRWRQDPARDVAELDLAIDGLTRAQLAGALDAADVYLLGTGLLERFEMHGRARDRIDAVAVWRTGLELPDLDGTWTTELLEAIGSTLVEQSVDESDPRLLEEAIRALTWARDTRPYGQRLMSVLALGEALLHRSGDGGPLPTEAEALLDCLVEILDSPGSDDPDLHDMVAALAVTAVQRVSGSRTWSSRLDHALAMFRDRLAGAGLPGSAGALIEMLTWLLLTMRGMVLLWNGGDPATAEQDIHAGTDGMERALSHPEMPAELHDELRTLTAFLLFAFASLSPQWSGTRPLVIGEVTSPPDLHSLTAASQHLQGVASGTGPEWLRSLLPFMVAMLSDREPDEKDLQAVVRDIPEDVLEDAHLAVVLQPARAMALALQSRNSGNEEALRETATAFRRAYRLLPPGMPTIGPLLLGLGSTLAELAFLCLDPDLVDEAVSTLSQAVPLCGEQLATGGIDTLAAVLRRSRSLTARLPSAAAAAELLAEAVRFEPVGERRVQLLMALYAADEFTGTGTTTAGPDPRGSAVVVPAGRAEPAPAGDGTMDGGDQQQSGMEARIEQLERETLHAAQDVASLARAEALMELADAYRHRARPAGAAPAPGDSVSEASPPPETPRARELTRLALREYARCVLLADDIDEGLAAAVAAQNHVPAIVSWYLDGGDEAGAVEFVESGRGLVLAAVTTSASVSQLLTEAGAPELARRWSEERASAEVRQEALRALGRSVRGMFLQSSPASTIDDVRAAIWSVGADAIAYLLPPDGDGAGPRILLVSATGQIEHLRLPTLGSADVDRLDRYRSAYAEAFGSDASSPGAAKDCDPGEGPDEDLASAHVNRWREQLRELGAWAHNRVMGPLVDLTRDWGLLRPPRVVLVPVGMMATVPWQAAWAPAQDGTPRFIVRELVLSFAASARQLAEAGHRRRLPLAGSPALVIDPEGTLFWAGRSGVAVRNAFYPGATYLGRPRTLSGQRPGTADEMLELLPSANTDGASLLQVSAHARAAGSPEDTVLHLADGTLPVTRVLGRARHRSPNAPGGLVVCDSCVTDVASAAQDEALTLSTAFLAAGAVGVIGTRWPVEDLSTAVMMFMFHHFLHEGFPEPADALRQAALWMLDPQRTAPPRMPPELARQVDSPELADPGAWAAFVHHGK